MQRAAGLSLTGSTREHILFVLHGSGRNGKTTFLKTIQLLLGTYASTAPPSLLMVAKNDQHPAQIADLFGRRFVAASETERGGRLNEGLVKSLTGGDQIKARRMRENFWEFRPTHKLWLATNHKPRIAGTDVAIWSRLKLIPFHAQFLEGDPRRDPGLPDRLAAELPGVLSWAVEGCIAWPVSYTHLTLPTKRIV